MSFKTLESALKLQMLNQERGRIVVMVEHKETREIKNPKDRNVQILKYMEEEGGGV